MAETISNPARGITSFYDFSSLEGNGGPTPPGASQQAGAKPADDVKPADPATTGGGTVTSGSASSAAGGATKTTTTTTVEGSPYEQFKGSNYEDLENFLRERMKEVPVETKEEQEKREKREKRLGFLSRLADGLGTFHTAFAHARGEKPMDMPQMSKHAEELFEKQKAARDKNRDQWVNYAITLGNLKDKDRDFNFRVTQTEQQQDNWQKQFDANRKDRADDVLFRDKQFDEGKRQFDVTAEENKRHNRATEGLQGASIAEQRRHNRASEGFERQRISASQDGRYTEFYSGSGMIKIPNTRLNQHNIAYVFSKTPADGRPTEGRDWQTGKTTPVSSDQMMTWIGSNIDDPNVQSALRAIGGVTTGDDNTPPSRRNNKTNTPPSRR